MATLKDIADRVGISVPTVSKILNNKSQKCASEKTQDLVWQAVRALGYTPNIHARKVASISNVTKVNVIAICMCREQELFFSNYYNDVLEKLELKVISQNYTPHTCEIEEIIEKKSPLKDQKLVGLMLIGEPSPRTLAKVSKLFPNLVVLSLEDGIIGCDKVFCSFRNAVYKTMKEAFGWRDGVRRQICFVGKKDSLAASFCREYLEKTKNYGEASFRVVYSDYTVSGGYVSGMLLAEEHSGPITVICEGRKIASGLQEAFLIKGIPVRKVRMFVLDDLHGNFKEPVYNSACMDLASAECAAQAWLLLLDRIRHQHKISVAYEVDSQMFPLSAGGK